MTSLLSEIGLNIQEAHAFSSIDGYSLDVFVVDGWPLEVFLLFQWITILGECSFSLRSTCDIAKYLFVFFSFYCMMIKAWSVAIYHYLMQCILLIGFSYLILSLFVLHLTIKHEILYLRFTGDRTIKKYTHKGNTQG